MAKTWTQEVDEGFLQAVVEGALDRVKYYADKGADLYQQDPEGRRNPLRLAAIRSHLHVVKHLVEERGVSPAKDGRVLHMTVMAGDHLKEIFTYLVSKGANIDGIDPTLGTPLMLSIREGADFKLTRWLVEQGANVAVVTPTGTALHNACEHGDIPIIDFLLKHGGDQLLNVGDARGFTPLTVAAYHRRNDVVKFLVEEYQADVNFKTDVCPLFMAVQNDLIDTVQLLLELGANANIYQEEKQCYALHLAASNNFLTIVDLLVDKGEAIVDCKGHYDYTPLFMAASEGYTECCRKLIQKGANVLYRSQSDNTTAVYHAVRANRVATTRLLLDHGADILSTRTENNETLVEYAKAKNFTEMANLLETWVNASDEERKKICPSCNKLVENAKRCSKCKAVWYCTSVCQKRDWPQHKLKCKEN